MSSKNYFTPRVGAFFLGACLTAGALLAAGGDTPVQEVEPGASYVTGPARVVDTLNQSVVFVPEGWFAIVPTRGLEGATTLANYDLESIGSALPEHGSHVLVEEMAKLDVTTRPLAGRTLEELVTEFRTPVEELAGPDFKVSQAVPVRVGDRDGFAYSVVDRGESIVLSLAWSSEKALVATIQPASSRHLEQALRVLSTVRGVDERADRRAFKGGDDLGALARSLGSLELREPKRGTLKYCVAWSGTDNATYAGNTPITLNLPFYWNTTWQAGGAGNFWGNWTHGNCYNDYYAIDFNRMNSTCTGYLDDSGQNVYAAAGGTAYPKYDANGYGYYVDVDHTSGNVDTRYAHMTGHNVTWGQTVTNQSVVGWVGSTGNSGGPHLHFGFYDAGYSKCGKAGGCPNGEAAFWTQSRKPSPMYTLSGSRTITDYSCYTAPP